MWVRIKEHWEPYSTGRQNDEKMSLKTVNTQSRATFFRHSHCMPSCCIRSRLAPDQKQMQTDFGFCFYNDIQLSLTLSNAISLLIWEKKKTITNLVAFTVCNQGRVSRTSQNFTGDINPFLFSIRTCLELWNLAVILPFLISGPH